MLIIIDGYNLLKQIFTKVKGKLDLHRKQLVDHLSLYKVQKHKDIKQIVLVFDGGFFNHATRETHKGIVVVFAGQDSSADEYILNYVKKNKEKQILMVTLDRELKDSCKKYGVDSVSVFDFYKILQTSILQDVVENMKSKRTVDTDIYKYDSDLEYHDDSRLDKTEINSKALDLLMEQYSVSEKGKRDDYKESSKETRKSKSKKMSKKDKKISRKIKKL